MKNKEEITKEMVEKVIKYLMFRYGDVDNGVRYMRIDEDDLFEDDGGVSMDTVCREIARDLNYKLAQNQQLTKQNYENKRGNRCRV